MAWIVCPNCAREADVELAEEELESLAVVSSSPAPEGFRKVQVGAFAESLTLYCTSCAVPARLRNLVPAWNQPMH